MALNYANGEASGIGYMEVWSGEPRSISGPLKVRERFSVSGNDRLVSSVNVRLKRVTGTAPLLVRLVADDGRVIAEGAVPATSFSQGDLEEARGSSWARLDFEEPVVLESSSTYDLVLATQADTEYSTFVIREGRGYDFPSTTFFADGTAEYFDGERWQAFHPSWRGPLDEGDLQFYFE
jgi:hypothetical protein